MKKAFKPALFVLLMCGVFGVDEVKSVSVMEGDSVTLNPDQTQIQGFLAIEWRFEDQLIASIDGSKPTYPNERFGDRLKLNQTGSLTITNMKTKHSGLYKLQIDLNSGPVHVDFAVTVYESPSVIDAGKAEMKRVSVNEGDPVTLQTDVTQISGDELIVWRCGEEGKLIAKADKEAKSSPLYYDERFRDRLENQTGSLTITDTRSTDSGFYSVKISSNKQTLYKRFTVTVIVTVSEPGLSPGAGAGIVLVFLAAVAAAAAAVGFIYYRRKISELRKQILRSVFATEGKSVHLSTDHPKIERGDEIQWMFGGEIIAEVKGGTGETHDGADDGRFRDRLQLNVQTGDLTIKSSTAKDAGDYKLNIISSKGNTNRTYRVIITYEVRCVSVTEGESVHLSTGRPKIERDDEIQWMFGDEIIAEIKEGTGKTHDGADGRFRDRLELNDQTGDLTIKNSTAEDDGRYNLKISSSKGNKNWTYSVIIRDKATGKPLMKGNNGKRVDESVVEMQPLIKSSLWGERAREEEFSLKTQAPPPPVITLTSSAPTTTQAPPPPVNHSDIHSSCNTSPAPLLSITLTSSTPATTQAPPPPVNRCDIIRSSYNTALQRERERERGKREGEEREHVVKRASYLLSSV